jgi:hypothetical protein
MKSFETSAMDEARFQLTVERLEVLLRRELSLARKGNIAEVGILVKEANELVRQLSGSKFFAEPQFKQNRNKLELLYRDLCLVLSSQMNDVSRELGKIYKGKKTVTLYRNNV